MNKNNFNYVSPTATVKEMQVEGVLCFSALDFMQKNSASFEEWTEETLTW